MLAWSSSRQITTYLCNVALCLLLPVPQHMLYCCHVVRHHAAHVVHQPPDLSANVSRQAGEGQADGEASRRGGKQAAMTAATQCERSGICTTQKEASETVAVRHVHQCMQRRKGSAHAGACTLQCTRVNTTN
jgi:hypothetical protein